MFSQARASGPNILRVLQQAAVDAGIFEAVVAAMRSAPDVCPMQHRGCYLLQSMCIRTEAGSNAGPRRDRAAQAGAIEAALDAMRFYPHEEGVQEWAISLLFILASETDNDSFLPRIRRIRQTANSVAILEAARANFPQNRGLSVHWPYLLAALRDVATAP